MDAEVLHFNRALNVVVVLTQVRSPYLPGHYWYQDKSQGSDGGKAKAHNGRNHSIEGTDFLTLV